MRFKEFLRTAVLLFAAAATALAIVSLAGASAAEDQAPLYFALGWWTLATVLGVWLGRRPVPSPGIARLLASARTSPSLPEGEPGALLFNRLWGLALFTVVAGGLAVLAPQVPAIGTGYALLCALIWRRQPAAVEAIENRDGVRFYVERTPPLKPTRLLRTPGLRKFEAAPTEAQEARAGR